MDRLKEIGSRAARSLEGRDWHKLSHNEKILVELLEELGYITPNNPRNGFVGKAVYEIESFVAKNPHIFSVSS